MKFTYPLRVADELVGTLRLRVRSEDPSRLGLLRVVTTLNVRLQGLAQDSVSGTIAAASTENSIACAVVPTTRLAPQRSSISRSSPLAWVLRWSKPCKCPPTI